MSRLSQNKELSTEKQISYINHLRTEAGQIFKPNLPPIYFKDEATAEIKRLLTIIKNKPKNITKYFHKDDTSSYSDWDNYMWGCD